jgi:hypothetical protein
VPVSSGKKKKFGAQTEEVAEKLEKFISERFHNLQYFTWLKGDTEIRVHGT